MGYEAKLHRLSSSYSRVWIRNPDARAKLATHIRSLYASGEIIITSASMVAIGIIAKSGAHRLLEPPQVRYPLWRADNNPAPDECHCRDFFEPDIQGPYWLKGQHTHHAYCCYRAGAAAAWKLGDEEARKGFDPDKLKRADRKLEIATDLEDAVRALHRADPKRLDRLIRDIRTTKGRDDRPYEELIDAAKL